MAETTVGVETKMPVFMLGLRQAYHISVVNPKLPSGTSPQITHPHFLSPFAIAVMIGLP